MNEYKYKYPNESFSGCDMTATIVYAYNTPSEEQTTDNNENVDTSGKGGKSIDTPTKNWSYGDPIEVTPSNSTSKWQSHTLGEIQTISYSIHMEKRPVRSIGNVNAKDYVMGQRTIAGSLVFAVFNKHFAKKIIAENNKMFNKGQAFLVDELPPFNIVISFANEYGLRSKLVIYGVRLLNEGQVMSINDIYTENTYQFVATDLEYMDDELTYESKKEGIFLIIKDSIKKESQENDFVKIKNSIDKFKDPFAAVVKDEVKLSVITKNATRDNDNGSATFSLFPNRSDGEIKITSSQNKVETITVDGRPSYSIPLAPDMYSAKYYKVFNTKGDSNTINFTIYPFVDKFDTQKYAPVIESLSDSYVNVLSNEVTHTEVQIIDVSSKEVKYTKLKNRRAKVTDLKPETRYRIATCNGENTMLSPYLEFETFNAADKPFEDFKRMVEANQYLLKYKTELNRYYEIIDEAKAMASKSSKFNSPVDVITSLKTKYESDLKNLSNIDDNYNDKYAELTAKIYACNELIYIAVKINNNIIGVTNNLSPVSIPKLFINSNYNNSFQFSDDTVSADFYRVIKSSPQMVSLVTADKFSTIDENGNSYEFKGKSGVNHQVQASRGTVRSPKLDFYEMTVAEKQEFINGNNDKEIITEANAAKINSIIKSEIGSIGITNSISDRLFMYKIKAIEVPMTHDAEVTKNEDGTIEVSTNIYNLIDNKFDSTFYLAVANKNDIMNNDYIYKKKFTNKEEVLTLKNIDFGLYINGDYAVWIEDENLEQISNVTTFTVTEDDNDDRVVMEYELSSIISDIKSRLKPYLPTTIFESLCAEIEYNEEINKLNIINKTIQFLLYCALGGDTLLKCLSAIKIYIGAFVNSDITIDKKLIGNALTISHESELSLTVFAFEEDNVESSTIYSNKESVIDINDYEGDYVLIVGTSSNMKSKSDVIFINKLNRKMEVL